MFVDHDHMCYCCEASVQKCQGVLSTTKYVLIERYRHPAPNTAQLICSPRSDKAPTGQQEANRLKDFSPLGRQQVG